MNEGRRESRRREATSLRRNFTADEGWELNQRDFKVKSMRGRETRDRGEEGRLES